LALKQNTDGADLAVDGCRSGGRDKKKHFASVELIPKRELEVFGFGAGGTEHRKTRIGRDSGELRALQGRFKFAIAAVAVGTPSLISDSYGRRIKQATKGEEFGGRPGKSKSESTGGGREASGFLLVCRSQYHRVRCGRECGKRDGPVDVAVELAQGALRTRPGGFTEGKALGTG